MASKYSLASHICGYQMKLVKKSRGYDYGKLDKRLKINNKYKIKDNRVNFLRILFYCFENSVYIYKSAEIWRIFINRIELCKISNNLVFCIYILESCLLQSVEEKCNTKRNGYYILVLLRREMFMKNFISTLKNHSFI